MDIPMLSMALSQQQTMTAVNIAVLGKSLDTIEESGDAFARMLEQSVTPNVGQHIDISV